MKKRRKICTQIKLLAATNALPQEYCHKLHPAQLSRYRTSFNAQEYYGYELMDISQEVVQTLKQINQHEFERKVIHSFLRVSKVFRNAFSSTPTFHKKLFEAKEKIVEVVQKVGAYLPIQSCAKYMGLSVSTLRNWVVQVRVQCSGSIINLCRKVHSTQLSVFETNQLKSLLQKPSLLHWPLVSVYYYALNQGIISMSISTWYKYAALLQVKRLKPRSIKHYGKSISATYPNQYWHADVTQFRTADGLLHYIYLVVDNYSKYILSWACSTKLCAAIRKQTFIDALQTALVYDPNVYSLNLLVDGGSENNNKTVHAFLEETTQIDITKLRALKDVPFSNSHAEAANRTLKCYYLNQQSIANSKELELALKASIHNLNHQRPHGRLQGLIPLEAFEGKQVDRERALTQLKEAKKARVEANKTNLCSKCS